MVSNTAHLFFTIKPPTFHQWTAQELEKLMSPITIVDKTTGTSTVVPFSSLKFAFRKMNGHNQLELVYDYGNASIENSEIRFSINPNATGLASIHSLAHQSANFAKLSSSNNGVDMYSYTEETYQFQKSVSAMSAFIGYIAMVFAFVGLLSPVGKLIIVEALAVVQLTFFSIIQFRKIPPTFIGLKNLILSSGYNDPNLFDSPIIQKDQTVFKLIGLDQSVFLNFNISFILFIGLPFLLGSIALMLKTVAGKKQR